MTRDNDALPIQLISTDFDGTIFAEFENPPIAPDFERLIADLQARGAKWVINTGRDMSSLMEALARAQISIQPDYLVLVEREIHLHDGVRYRGLDAWNNACAAAHRELFVQVRRDLPRLIDWVNARFHATVYEDPYSPFCLIAGNLAEANAIHAYLEEYCREVPGLAVVRNDVYARFSHVAYNKGTALAEVARLLGLGPEQVFAAGDHLNDLPMLSGTHAHWVGAPANAIEPVKDLLNRVGGYVSAHVHATGTADALQHALKTAGVQNAR
ncbi:MAG TPA: HAD family phosphatase [Verrucomicrobia bacterium]|nr:HAD family phosphatase [Verrucomicrobiota bacterium]HOB33221.1 HAD hydrolase family protein [Verrucomicrobiota bacterium]HOP97302.1 HAD hydrolase family protein [Verrucomicrobiota bacterium]HPU55907.1 HAD hydrolase family protein [Verrucomicrobiota bacterium]